MTRHAPPNAQTTGACRASVTINGVTLECEGQAQFVQRTVALWLQRVNAPAPAVRPTNQALALAPPAAPVSVRPLADLAALVQPRHQRDWVALVAAYLHFVLGQTRFTRQDLLAHVHTLGDATINRRFSNNLSKTLGVMQRRGTLLYEPQQGTYALSYQAARSLYPQVAQPQHAGPMALAA